MLRFSHFIHGLLNRYQKYFWAIILDEPQDNSFIFLRVLTFSDPTIINFCRINSNKFYNKPINFQYLVHFSKEDIYK